MNLGKFQLMGDDILNNNKRSNNDIIDLHAEEEHSRKFTACSLCGKTSLHVLVTAKKVFFRNTEQHPADALRIHAG